MHRSASASGAAAGGGRAAAGSAAASVPRPVAYRRSSSRVLVDRGAAANAYRQLGGVSCLADNALAAFVNAAVKLHGANQPGGALYKYRVSEAVRAMGVARGSNGAASPFQSSSFISSSFRVRMGFGLHIGWAVEGAIGSSIKIDASYLSPSVNVAARIEAATRLYGVDILVSKSFAQCLSLEAVSLLRRVDRVRLKGCTEPVELYTFDWHPPAGLRLLRRTGGLAGHPRVPGAQRAQRAATLLCAACRTTQWALGGGDRRHNDDFHRRPHRGSSHHAVSGRTMEEGQTHYYSSTGTAGHARDASIFSAAAAACLSPNAAMSHSRAFATDASCAGLHAAAAAALLSPAGAAASAAAGGHEAGSGAADADVASPACSSCGAHLAPSTLLDAAGLGGDTEDEGGESSDMERATPQLPQQQLLLQGRHHALAHASSLSSPLRSRRRSARSAAGVRYVRPLIDDADQRIGARFLPPAAAEGPSPSPSPPSPSLPSPSSPSASSAPSSRAARAHALGREEQLRDLARLQPPSVFSQEFADASELAVECYLGSPAEGVPADWGLARHYAAKGLELRPADGPLTALLRVLEAQAELDPETGRMGAPRDWKGFRVMDEK
jgi:hypothetical protein